MRAACLRVGARCGKSPTEDDQLGAHSAGPTRCHGLFGLLLLPLLFIEPRLLRVRSQWCTSAPRPHKPPLLPRLSCRIPHLPQPPLLLGKAAASPVITDHVCEVSACQSLGSSPSLHCPVWRQWLESWLSGVLPRPCLPVCLPVCFGPSACPSVSLCHLSAAAALSLPAAGLQTDTDFFFFFHVLSCGW